MIDSMKEQLWEGLAPNQREIAILVRLGLRDCEIAKRLGVTETSVRNSVERLYRKLGAGDRFELAMSLAELILQADSLRDAQSSESQTTKRNATGRVAPQPDPSSLRPTPARIAPHPEQYQERFASARRSKAGILTARKLA